MIYQESDRTPQVGVLASGDLSEKVGAKLRELRLTNTTSAAVWNPGLRSVIIYACPGGWKRAWEGEPLCTIASSQ